MTDIKTLVNNRGGARKLSQEYDIPEQTIYSWIKRNSIPRWWRQIIGLDEQPSPAQS